LFISEYESKGETSIGSTLFPTTPLLLTFNISQHNYPVIIRQLQKQLATQQAQIQALLEGGAVAGRGAEERTINLDVAKLQVFDRDSSKVSGFMIYKE